MTSTRHTPRLPTWRQRRQLWCRLGSGAASTLSAIAWAHLSLSVCLSLSPGSAAARGPGPAGAWGSKEGAKPQTKRKSPAVTDTTPETNGAGNKCRQKALTT